MRARHLAGRVSLVLASSALLAGCAADATPTPSRATVTPTSAPSIAIVTPTAVAPPAPTPSPEATIHIMTVAPSPTAIAYGPASVVDGAETCSITSGPSTTDADGTEHMRGGKVECTDYANDPRVSGTYSGTWAIDWWGTPDHGDGALVQWGTERLVNAGGTWEGRLAGVYSTEQRDIITIWWTGTGGYAGLTYFELLTGDSPWKLQGLIFPGAIPTAAVGASATTAPPAPTSASAPTSAAQGEPPRARPRRRPPTGPSPSSRGRRPVPRSTSGRSRPTQTAPSTPGTARWAARTRRTTRG